MAAKAVQKHIRWMIRNDVPDVLAAETASLHESESLVAPLTHGRLLAMLRRRNCIGHVVEIDDKFAGFYLYELERTCLSIQRLCVDPSYRGLGVGRAMLARMFKKLDEGSLKDRSRIEVIVPERMMTLLKFFSHGGFEATDVVRGHLPDQDGIRMIRLRA